ncbi:MAG: hypothetical protein ACREF8_04165 [Chthoniobacterales bacterium]
MIALLSTFGPWSAGAISKQSQLDRIVAILQQNHLWAGDAAQASLEPLTLSAGESERLRSSLAYLLRIHGSESLRPLFRKVFDFASLKNANDANRIIGALHITTKTPVRGLSPRHDEIMAHREQTVALPIGGFRRLWQVALIGGFGGDPGRSFAGQFGDVRIGLVEGAIQVVGVGETTPKVLPLPASLITAVENDSKLPIEASTIDFTSDNTVIALSSITLS